MRGGDERAVGKRREPGTTQAQRKGERRNARPCTGTQTSGQQGSRKDAVRREPVRNSHGTLDTGQVRALAFAHLDQERRGGVR